ncbi:MAG: hypothetical protein K2X66_06940 [Cyanobacteria bacterium]|nr:hypothetical protein [Cyanobacteriota bacterium]
MNIHLTTHTPYKTQIKTQNLVQWRPQGKTTHFFGSPPPGEAIEKLASTLKAQKATLPPKRKMIGKDWVGKWLLLLSLVNGGFHGWGLYSTTPPSSPTTVTQPAHSNVSQNDMTEREKLQESIRALTEDMDCIIQGHGVEKDDYAGVAKLGTSGVLYYELDQQRERLREKLYQMPSSGVMANEGGKSNSVFQDTPTSIYKREFALPGLLLSGLMGILGIAAVATQGRLLSRFNRKSGNLYLEDKSPPIKNTQVNGNNRFAQYEKFRASQIEDKRNRLVQAGMIQKRDENKYSDATLECLSFIQKDCETLAHIRLNARRKIPQVYDLFYELYQHPTGIPPLSDSENPVTDLEAIEAFSIFQFFENQVHLKLAPEGTQRTVTVKQFYEKVHQSIQDALNHHDYFPEWSLMSQEMKIVFLETPLEEIHPDAVQTPAQKLEILDNKIFIQSMNLFQHRLKYCRLMTECLHHPLPSSNQEDDRLKTAQGILNEINELTAKVQVLKELHQNVKAVSQYTQGIGGQTVEEAKQELSSLEGLLRNEQHNPVIASFSKKSV